MQSMNKMLLSGLLVFGICLLSPWASADTVKVRVGTTVYVFNTDNPSGIQIARNADGTAGIMIGPNDVFVGTENSGGTNDPVSPPKETEKKPADSTGSRKWGNPPAPPSDRTVSTPPKTFILLVYGTNDPKVKMAMDIAYKKFGKMLNDVGLSSKAKCEVFEYKGNSASPAAIIKGCDELLKRAGPNDTCIVYVTCHGTYEPNEQKHYLFPLAQHAKDINYRDNKCLDRSEIMKRLKIHRHRLDIVITDACSAVHAKPPSSEGPLPTPPAGSDVYPKKLYTLLTKGRGKIDIGSSSPEGQDGLIVQGEQALLLTPKSISDADPFDIYGSVFGNALAMLGREDDIIGNYTPRMFINELKVTLGKKYIDSEFDLKESTGADVSAFKSQTLKVFELKSE